MGINRFCSREAEITSNQIFSWPKRMYAQSGALSIDQLTLLAWDKTLSWDHAHFPQGTEFAYWKL